ncbi:MAG TPA: hypothetical protein VFA44_02705 [Gaiellaceae bacterium]|nr:hypothetical protein [Gaiellaceae bacterium]
MVTLLIPVYILGFVLAVFGVLVLLGRFRGGRYLRPVVQLLLRVPYLGTLVRRLTESALERSNPELASAIKKLERLGASRDPRRAQQALSQLTPAERKAFMAAAGESQQFPTPTNRAQRRRLERQRQRG